MGILDSKERIIDAIVTEEGRSQISIGEIDFSYATFTDLGTFYDGVEGGVALEASDRIMFEASSRKQDIIVPVAGDDGSILQFQSGDLKFFGTSILSGTSVEYNNDGRGALTQVLETYLNGSEDNFAQNYIVGEIEEFSNVKRFEIEGSASSFLSPHDSHPDHDSVFFYPDSSTNNENSVEGGAKLESLPSLFEDPDLQMTLNYSYLPPEDFTGNKLSRNSRFRFTKLNPDESEPKRDSEDRIRVLKESVSGHVTLPIRSKTSRPNMLFQVFERSESGNEGDSGISKLVLVDKGFDTSGARVFLAGKVFSDSFGRDTFVNIFIVRFF